MQGDRTSDEQRSTRHKWDAIVICVQISVSVHILCSADRADAKTLLLAPA